MSFRAFQIVSEVLTAFKQYFPVGDMIVKLKHKRFSDGS